MIKTPKISIVIPVYNTGKYLKKCLDSLRFQTYENLEVICVDDCSTDNSFDILKEYESLDERFKIYQLTHSGTSVARNFGLDKATGEYVSFIDSDDWVFLTLYQTFIKYLQNCTVDIDIYIFNVAAYVFGRNDVVKQTFFDLSDWNKKNGAYPVYTFDDCMRPFSRNLSVANRIYRKEFLLSNDIRFPENMKYEDLFFCVKSSLRAKTIMINEEVFYRYRNMIAESTSSTVTPKVFDIFKILDLIENEIDDLNLYESYKYALFQFKYNVFPAHFKLCPPDLRDKYFQEMRERLLVAETRNLDVRIYQRLKNYPLFELIKSNDYKLFKSKFL